MNDANANRRFRIVKADREELIFLVENDSEFPGTAFAVLLADAFGEDPGMTGSDLRFDGRSQAEVKPAGFSFQEGSSRLRIE